MKKIVLPILCLMLTSSILAQEDVPPIDKNEQKLVIDSVVVILDNNYVYPDVAKEMGELILKNFKSGEYTDITSPFDFSERLTTDLRSVSHDKHLGVMYAPEMIAMIKQSQENPEDDAYEEYLNDQLRRTNYGYKEVKILPGNIGYVDFRQFASTGTGAGETAVAVMQFLKNSDAIIFDLTRNGGGSPSMIQLLTTYLYEGESKHLNTFYWRPTEELNQFWTLTYVPGSRMPDVDVYVLTSGSTFSGAEEFTYNLKNMERAIIVGETTGGGAHPVDRKIINDNFGIQVPMGKAINPITETNWEGTGIDPHFAVPSDKALDKAYWLALDSLSKKTDNEELLTEYQWIMDGLKVKTDPVKLDEKVALSYTGQYGPRKITFENGSLYYQREQRPKMKMTPMTENLFMFDDLDYFRLEFIIKNEEAVAVVGHYDNGRTDRHEKMTNEK